MDNSLGLWLPRASPDSSSQTPSIRVRRPSFALVFTKNQETRLKGNISLDVLDSNDWEDASHDEVSPNHGFSGFKLCDPRDIPEAPLSTPEYSLAGPLVRYRVEKLLGKGHHAKVYLARDTVLEKDVALKQFTSFNHASEAEILKKLNTHPNIVQFLDTLENHLVMEYLSGGNVDYHPPLDEMECKLIGKDLFSALDWLNRHRICHRDVKPANLLYNQSTCPRMVKLCDFSIACSMDSPQIKDAVGAPAYLSPELIQQGDIVPEKLDLYSAGCTLYSLLSGRLPYEATSVSEMVEKICTEQVDFHLVPATSRPILEALMEKNVVKRLSIDQVLTHEWFNDVR